MKTVILVVCICLMLAGCSSAIITPSTDSTALSTLKSAGTPNTWTWGTYTIAISEDHMQADLIPERSSSLHLNVNDFVEGPLCPDCLTIGKPIPQGDGTIKLKVWLRHPFPGHPLYTGFDVRGIVVFKATDYMVTTNYTIATGSGDQYILMLYPELNYSDPNKGGGGLLNADGYTFYLNPLLEYAETKYDDPMPILNYSKGKYANGDSPDCTVNPYILFSDGSPRRMFKVNDFMQRTFHIKPPTEGPFEFGYVVQACWAQPTTTPVTDPVEDFPVEANCEDPWQIGIEQIKLIDYDVAGQPIFRATIKHRPEEEVSSARILVPSLSTDPGYNIYNHPIGYYGPNSDPELTNIIDDETTEVLLRIKPINMANIGDGLVPGHHLGILSVRMRGEAEGGIGPYESQLYMPLGVMPVDVYVELPDG